jgi:hypothetical protein
MIAAGFVFWIGAILWLSWQAVETDGPIYWIGAVVVFTAGIGFGIQKGIDQRNSGPCVQSEIQMHYNPATKTVMPAKVCLNRGEWE